MTAKQYHWQGLDKNQQFQSGILTAKNTDQVNLQLLAIDIIPTQIKAQQTNAHKKIKRDNVTHFLQQLSTLLSSNIPVLQALALCKKSQAQVKLIAIIQHLQSLINQGHSLSHALSYYPTLFNTMLVNMIEVGEQTGTLNTILQRVIQQRQQLAQSKQKIKKALFYPCTIVAVSLIISMVMLLFIVPQFEQVFSSFGAELPAATQLILLFSDKLQQHGPLIIVYLMLLAIFIGLCHRYFKPITLLLDTLLLKLPLIGTLLNSSYQSRFCYLLATSSASKLTIPDALKLMSSTINNLSYKKSIQQIQAAVSAGQTLQQAMQGSKRFAEMICDMVAIGEETGQLDIMLQHLSKHYQQHIDDIIDNLGNLLEPCMMIFIGLIIGGLVIAMYLPIFNMGTVIS